MRALVRLKLRRNKNGIYNSMASFSILQNASHKLSGVRCLLSILYRSWLAMYADMDLKSALFHKKPLLILGYSFDDAPVVLLIRLNCMVL